MWQASSLHCIRCLSVVISDRTWGNSWCVVCCRSTQLHGAMLCGACMTWRHVTWAEVVMLADASRCGRRSSISRRRLDWWRRKHKLATDGSRFDGHGRHACSVRYVGDRAAIDDELTTTVWWRWTTLRQRRQWQQWVVVGETRHWFYGEVQVCRPHKLAVSCNILQFQIYSLYYCWKCSIKNYACL